MGVHYTNRGVAFVVDDWADYDVTQYSWQQDKDGYVRRWDGTLHKECRLHRFLMGFPDGSVDHIDGDKLNNVLNNLRTVSSKHNSWNNNVKGVSQLKSGKWMARIMSDGKRVTLGCSFKTREEAEAAYRTAWDTRASGIV